VVHVSTLAAGQRCEVAGVVHIHASGCQCEVVGMVGAVAVVTGL